MMLINAFTRNPFLKLAVPLYVLLKPFSSHSPPSAPAFLDLLLPFLISSTLANSPLLHTLLRLFLKPVRIPRSTWPVLPFYLVALLLKSHLALLAAGIALFHCLQPSSENSADAFKVMLLIPGFLMADRIVIDIWKMQRLLMNGELATGHEGAYLEGESTSMMMVILF
jgi:hypothetical protein